MASIIKVDQIQTAAGGTPSLSDLGVTVPTSSLPSGSVLQIQHVITGSEFYTTSTGATDTGFSISITPTTTSSKILITLAGGRLAPNDGGVHVQIRRNTTEISSNEIQRTGFGTNSLQYPLSLATLDSSHNTTSSITYRVYAWVPNGGSVAINNGSSQNFTITAIEFA